MEDSKLTTFLRISASVNCPSSILPLSLAWQASPRFWTRIRWLWRQDVVHARSTSAKMSSNPSVQLSFQKTSPDIPSKFRVSNLALVAAEHSNKTRNNIWLHWNVRKILNCKLIRHLEILEKQLWSLLRLAIPEFGQYIKLQRSDFIVICLENILPFPVLRFLQFFHFLWDTWEIAYPNVVSKIQLYQPSFPATLIHIFFVRVCDSCVLDEEFSYGILLQKA